MDYTYAIKHFAEAIRPETIDMVVKPSNIHHRLVKTRNKKKYYLLKKNLPFLKAGEVFEDSSGMRETINLSDLQYCIKIGVDRICFIYPDRKIYWINPLYFEDWGDVRETESNEITCSVPLKYLRRLE